MCLGYPVTIIVEGGIHSLEVIENDIEKKRPVVLIQVCTKCFQLNVLISLHSLNNRAVVV